MERYLKLIGGYVAVVLLCVSCGKYNFDFKDGYQEGDSVASEILTDTTMFVADKSMYTKARIYPGLVGDAVARLKQDTVVVLDLPDLYIPADDYKVQSTPVPFYSTGLYAPAGEVVRIVVPQGVSGLMVQVGAHTDNITGKDAPRREAIIYTRKELFAGVNYVKNLFGGTIWIYNSVAKTEAISLAFAGAVRTSDFILGKSNLADWQRDVLANDVPWLELRAKRTVFTVPRSLIVRFIQQGRANGVEEALQLWDKTYEDDYYKWMGLTETASQPFNAYPQLPERAVMDIHPSAGYAHSGNPWVMQEDEYWLDELINPETVRKGTSWGTYHEVGHNYQQVRSWSWSDLGETTNNLFVFNAARNRGVTQRIGFHPALAEMIPAALAFADGSGAKNFSALPAAVADGAPFFRLTPFLQIFDKVKGKNGESGWDFMPYIYTRSRNEDITLALDQAKKDYFYRQLCHFAGRDYQRFFTAWGIAISGSAKREIRNLYPPMQTAVWQYNPLTFSGGDGAVAPKYDLPGGTFEFTANAATAAGESIGSFAALIDGNPATYWHTCYNGCSPATTLPVNIYMDMKDVTAFKGFYIQNRQGNTYQPRVNVYISNDRSNWTKMGEYELAKSSESAAQRNARREFAFPNMVESRYVRFEFAQTNLGGEVHVALAELGVFYDI